MRGLTIFCKWHHTESLCDGRAIFVNEKHRRGVARAGLVEYFGYRLKSANAFNLPGVRVRRGGKEPCESHPMVDPAQSARDAWGYLTLNGDLDSQPHLGGWLRGHHGLTVHKRQRLLNAAVNAGHDPRRGTSP